MNLFRYESVCSFTQLELRVSVEVGKAGGTTWTEKSIPVFRLVIIIIVYAQCGTKL
jgi:hypothetical protein